MKSYLVNSKELKVVEVLEEYGPCSAKEIAKNIGVTPRTVLNYIKDLNYAIGKEVVEIKFGKGRKYHLYKKNNEKYKKIINVWDKNDISTPEERVKEIARILLENKKIVKIEDLADDFYVSRTTLIKDLKRVSLLFKNYDIVLKGKPNSGIEIIGTEMNIRLCLAQILFKIENKLTEEPKENIKFSKFEKVVKKVLKRVFAKTNFKISRGNYENLVTHISIALERFEQGFRINEVPSKIKNIDNKKEFEVSVLIGKELNKEIDMNLPKEELLYICIHLLGRKPIEEMMETENHIEVKPVVKKIVSNMLDEINKATGFLMKDDKELIWGLELHLNFAINRLMFNMNIRNPLIKEVKKKYPIAFELATIGAKVIEKELDVKVNEHEISYIAMHIGSYIERNNYKYRDIQRVALICGTGLGTAQLMLVKIKKVLGDVQEIKTFSSSFLDPQVLEEFDIIFTTIDLELNIPTPIIKLDVLFDENELHHKIVYRKLSQQTTNKNLYAFKNLLEKDMFFTIKLKKPEEVIEYMAQKCIEAGKVDKEFKERLLERERLAPTAFDNFIALPHAINYKSDKIQIAIGVLKNTIKWANKPIKVVFMVIVPNEIVEDTNLFIRVYEDILKVGQNKNFIQKISKVNNFEEFISLF